VVSYMCHRVVDLEFYKVSYAVLIRTSITLFCLPPSVVFGLLLSILTLLPLFSSGFEPATNLQDASLFCSLSTPSHSFRPSGNYCGQVYLYV
jgi:hypothetical protein